MTADLEALQPGDVVLTPSGRPARVLEVIPARGEVRVEWVGTLAERADFRLCHLRRIEEPEA